MTVIESGVLAGISFSCLLLGTFMNDTDPDKKILTRIGLLGNGVLVLHIISKLLVN